MYKIKKQLLLEKKLIKSYNTHLKYFLWSIKMKKSIVCIVLVSLISALVGCDDSSSKQSIPEKQSLYKINCESKNGNIHRMEVEDYSYDGLTLHTSYNIELSGRQQKVEQFYMNKRCVIIHNSSRIADLSQGEQEEFKSLSAPSDKTYDLYCNKLGMEDSTSHFIVPRYVINKNEIAFVDTSNNEKKFYKIVMPKCSASLFD